MIGGNQRLRFGDRIRFGNRGVLLLILAALVSSSLGAEDKPVRDIGSRLELFLDDYLIDRLQGARLKLHKPRSKGVVLRFDEPWEGEFSGFPRIVDDSGTYRMYYRGLPPWKKGEPLVESTCVAVSRDGIHWEKPDVGRIELLGSTRNNAVFPGSGFAPFLDTRPGVPHSERLKALKGPPRLETGIGVGAYVSSDGIRWEKMHDAYPGERLGSVFWSAVEDRYVQYVRSDDESSDELIRTVSRSTSSDFTTWGEFAVMDFGSNPPTVEEQLYTIGVRPYVRAPHIYLALAARFVPHRRSLTDEQCGKLGRHPLGGGCSSIADTVLLGIRASDPNRARWTFSEAFVRPGLEPSSWSARTNYPGEGFIATSEEEISFYVQRDYGFKTNGLERFVVRTDGFASVRAPYGGGEFLTRPLRFSGNELVLNYATSAAGGIRVEVQDRKGEPVPGRSLNDCPEIIGDEIERVVRWQEGSDLGRLQGTVVRLRFVMKDADLFSIRFR
jgi:hypothetical protein